MSIAGIGSSNFYSAYGAQNTQSPLQQIETEFQQLGQALQSGNLTQAQQDFTTLTQNLQSANPASSTAAATSAVATNAAATSSSTASTVSQEFSQLGEDLQSGNLANAQQDFATLQSSLQQQQSTALAAGGHHHHFHAHNSSQSASQQTSTQQTSPQSGNPITQAFTSLAQSLESGNLSGAQSAYSSLQADLQQIDGFSNAGLAGSASTSAETASTTGGLSVSA